MDKKNKPKVFTEFAMYSFATFYATNYRNGGSYEDLLSEWINGLTTSRKDIIPTKRILKTMLNRDENKKK